MSFPTELANRVEDAGVIAVLVIDDADHAVPLAKALMDGGVQAMELTLRTDAALESLQAVREKVPQMLAGIGTILTPEQLQSVHDAGGEFGVAPGLNPRVLQKAEQIGLPFAPGIVTPSDIEQAVELGCRHLKFFPAEPVGGFGYLKSMSAPYKHLNLQYIPLGGINSANMLDYLASDLVPAVGGSWIATRDLIAAEAWETITQNAAEARAAIDQLRQRKDEA